MTHFVLSSWRKVVLDLPDFGKTLRRLREDAGLTQEQLAAATGLTRSRINNYENGLREPDFEMLELFADFFNTDMNGLICGSPGLTEAEETLLGFFRELNPEGQRRILDYALDLTNGGRYSKKDSASGLPA